jgi:hypothetical protein
MSDTKRAQGHPANVTLLLALCGYGTVHVKILPS